MSIRWGLAEEFVYSFEDRAEIIGLTSDLLAARWVRSWLSAQYAPSNSRFVTVIKRDRLCACYWRAAQDGDREPTTKSKWPSGGYGNVMENSLNGVSTALLSNMCKRPAIIASWWRRKPQMWVSRDPSSRYRTLDTHQAPRQYTTPEVSHANLDCLGLFNSQLSRNRDGGTESNRATFRKLNSCDGRARKWIIVFPVVEAKKNRNNLLEIKVMRDYAENSKEVEEVLPEI